MSLEKPVRDVREASDVTDTILGWAEEIYDGWYADDDRIDWEDFIDRLCKWGDNPDDPWDIDSYACPAVEKIKRHIRQYRQETQ